MKTGWANIVWCSLLALLFYSCANQVSPTGGPKDTQPPQILSTYPENKSTNFTGKKVRLVFDEYIAIDNPQQQVVISPPMEPFPEFVIKGKELQITFKDSLRSNTTYTINIAAAVKDITENNAVPSFQYVFSTGDYVDSLFVTGRVVDAEKGGGVEGVLVMLYDALDDSVVYKQKPYYFGRTDKSGSFRIENIKEGQFKVFALKDENFNLKFDLPNEKIAFWPVPITISDSAAPPFELRLFQEERKRLQLIESVTSNRGFNQFIYSLPVENVTVKPLLDTLNFAGSYIEYNPTRDTIGHWYQYNNSARSVLLVVANDTLIDTITVKAPAFTADSLFRIGRPGQKSAVQIKGRAAAPNSLLELGTPFVFELNRPATALQLDRIYVLEDTVKAVVPKVYFADSAQRKIAVDYIWKAGSFYRIVFLDSAITDRYGLKNDSLRFELNARKADEYGVITITVDSLEPSKQYILEASLGEGSPPVIREVLTGVERFNKKYGKLIPGNYKVRIIRDANFNAQWDTGDYLKGLQPERIYVHPQEVALKPNWEMELEIEMER